MDKGAQLSDLWDEDLAQWRALPVSGLLLAHLQTERQLALEAIADDIREGRDRPAATASGGVAIIDSILAALNPGPRPVEPEEIPFIDPAER